MVNTKVIVIHFYITKTAAAKYHNNKLKIEKLQYYIFIFQDCNCNYT